MKNFYVTYNFKNSGDRAEFLKEIDELVKISRSEPGCIRYEYYYPVDFDCGLLLWEQWETGKDQEDHMKREHFPKILALKDKFGAETEMTVAETL